MAAPKSHPKTEKVEEVKPGEQTPVTVDSATGTESDWNDLHAEVKRDPNDETPILPGATAPIVGEVVK